LATARLSSRASDSSRSSWRWRDSSASSTSFAGGRRTAASPNTPTPEVRAHEGVPRSTRSQNIDAAPYRYPDSALNEAGTLPHRVSASQGFCRSGVSAAHGVSASPEVAADRLLPGVARQLRVEQRGGHAVLAHLVRPDSDLFEQTVPDPGAAGRLRLDEDI